MHSASPDERAAGIERIERGKRGVGKRILLAVEPHRAALQIDALDQSAVPHLVLGMSGDDLRFEVELDHRDRLLHPGHLRRFPEPSPRGWKRSAGSSS